MQELVDISQKYGMYEDQPSEADTARRALSSQSDGAGQAVFADAAVLPMPALSEDFVEGHCAFAANAATAEAPSTRDGEGRGDIADSALRADPSPSQEHQGDGLLHCADSAATRLPSPENGEVGHMPAADKAAGSLSTSPHIDRLAELQVRRKFYISATNKLTNAIKALVRRSLGWRYDEEEGDREKTNARSARIVAAALSGRDVKPEDAEVFNSLVLDLAVVAESIKPLQKARAEVEKDMKRSVRDLAVYDWASKVHGFGELGLGVIVAEAGDLAKYPKKGHLWKRLGLASHEGKAYSTWRREGGLTADDWVAAGYSPRRRAEVYAVISEPLFRQQSVVQGPYRARYDARRARTAELHPDWTKAHSHADGLRVMTKYLIRDLWVAWRRASQHAPEMAEHRTPAAEPNRSEAPGVLPRSAAGISAPSSDPIGQPDAGNTNEQKARIDEPLNAAMVVLPTARPIRRKAKDMSPPSRATTSGRSLLKCRQQAARHPSPTARNKRRKVNDVVPHEAAPVLPTG